jgi:hypothetical protein
MTKIDDGYYYFDIDKMMEWVQVNPNDKKSFETEILKNEKGEVVNTRTIESNDSAQGQNTRYDLIKEMLVTLYNAGIESDGDGISYSQSFDKLSIGSKLVINSFQNSKFLVNKLDKNK